MTTTRTVFWDYQQSEIKMIDQRQLPWAFEIASFNNYQDVATAITTMVVRGAPAIGGAGGFGMAIAAQNSNATTRDALLKELAAAADILNAARPTAVNLSWAVNQQLRLAQIPTPHHKR